MFSKLFVPSVSSTLPRLLPSRSLLNHRGVSVSPHLLATSQFELPRRRNGRTEWNASSFSWMATAAGGHAEFTAAPTSVPVRVAHELLLAGHRYLDVRTPEEFCAGHAVGAINIAYMYRVGSGMTKNPHFLDEVLSHFGKDDEIIVGCQLGKRSLMASTDLVSAGFTGITDIAGGYAAWTQNGLPVES